MNEWKDVTSIIQSVVTSIGIIIAGIWAYFLFIRQRLSYPRINIDFFVDDAQLPENTRLVHVQVDLKNIGNTLVHSDYAQLRLRKIVPLPDEIIPNIKDGLDPVSIGNTEYEWPAFVNREWKFNEEEFEIEPLEKDSLHADFLIPDEIIVIELYFFIKNPKKKKKDLGWTHTQIYSFKKE